MSGRQKDAFVVPVAQLVNVLAGAVAGENYDTLDADTRTVVDWLDSLFAGELNCATVRVSHATKQRIQFMLDALRTDEMVERGQHLYVTQEEDGADMAPEYVCDQCGAPLVYDSDGCVSCPVHGSEFLPPAMERAMQRALDAAGVPDLDALPVVCPSCAAARAVSLGRRGARHYFSCKECGEEFWLQEFDDRTQEEDTDGAHVVTLRHVPPVEDSLAECPSCATEIGVLLWRDGCPLIQQCPACGDWLSVHKHSKTGDVTLYRQSALNGDILPQEGVLLGRIARLRDALAQYENYFAENPTRDRYGAAAAAMPDKLALVATEALAEDDETNARELFATTQEAQPVPVSAIAYLMADIAPTDEYDTAKQHEARATVIAWLESLEAEEDGAE